MCTMTLLRSSLKAGENFIRFSEGFRALCMDPGLYNSLENPLKSMSQFFSGPVTKSFSNSDLHGQVVMDMGCGPGNFSTKMILSQFPNVKKLLAIDRLPNMIEFAKKNHSHPKVEYSVGDISQWSTVGEWEGQISTLFSIHVFHWLTDQKQGFRHVHQLLQPGGHAAFYFVLQSTFFAMCAEMESKTRWSEYLKDVSSCVPVSHTENLPPEYYTDMVEEIGFEIEYCSSDLKVDLFQSDDLYRDFYSSICVLLPYIPLALREEFKDDIFSTLLRLNRRINGLPTQEGRNLELIVRKV